MRDDLPKNIDLENVPEDPTELVTENKEYLLELKECGLDGRKIGKMIRNYHDLRLSDIGKKKEQKKGWIEFDDKIGTRLENEEPWPSRAELKKYRALYEKSLKDIDYAIRSAKGLINSPYISSETKASLRNDVEHLLGIKKRGSYKSYANDRLLHPDEKNITRPATSITQMTGFQVVEIYNYIKSFRAPHYEGEKDIFSIICEIFNGLDNLKPYTKKDIKNLYYNNFDLLI